MMFVFHGSAGLLSGCCGKWIHVQTVGEERNACWCLCLCLVQYGTRRKCPLFLCKDFFLKLVKCRFILMSTFSSRPESVPWQRENLRQAMQCRYLNNGQKAMGLVCAEWDQSAFSSVDKRRNLTDQDITEPILESDSWHIHWKTKTLLLRVTVTLWTQTSHSGLTIHTILLYLHSTSLQEVPVSYEKQRHLTSINTLPQ